MTIFVTHSGDFAHSHEGIFPTQKAAEENADSIRKGHTTGVKTVTVQQWSMQTSRHDGKTYLVKDVVRRWQFGYGGDNYWVETPVSK
jgi:hypothetical protein